MCVCVFSRVCFRAGCSGGWSVAAEPSGHRSIALIGQPESASFYGREMEARRGEPVGLIVCG